MSTLYLCTSVLRDHSLSYRLHGHGALLVARRLTPMAMRFLTSTRIHCLQRLFVGPLSPLTQPWMLASAAASPINIQHYAGQDDIFDLAAHLAEKIARNHAFQDGNKRTSLLSADVFLRLNNAQLTASDVCQSDELARAQVSVVTAACSVEALCKYYRSIAKESDRHHSPE